MAYRGPKVKVSRRLGLAITPKAQKGLELRPHPPGQHGKSRRPSKISDYGKQLLEKQRLRYQYNLGERQLRNYARKALQAKGNAQDNLLHLLESRLDALVLRAGLARTIHAARQYVVHGHVRVNGKKVDVPSYPVKPGDKVSLRAKSRDLECFDYALQQASPIPYISVDKDGREFVVNYVPQRDEVPVVCDLPLVIEFYSRMA